MRFSGLEPSNHSQSSADSITITSGYSFRYTQPGPRRPQPPPRSKYFTCLSRAKHLLVPVGRRPAIGAKPIENCNDFLVADLTEIGVKESNRAEVLMGLETYRLVGLHAQGFERVGRRHWHGQHEFSRVTRPDGAQRGARRRAGGHAVIDHDRNVSTHLGADARTEIEAPAPFDLGEFALANGV